MGVALMREEPLYTYEDYAAWPEDERWELIDGVAYQMSAPTTTHQDRVVSYITQLKNQLRGKPCKPYVSPVDVMPKVAPGHEFKRTDTVVQPDVLVVCDPAQIEVKGILGAPSFVLEILSPSTSHKDQTQKLALYEKTGVAEYWVVNPDNLSLWVYRLKADGRYGAPEAYLNPGPLELSSVPGVRLDIGEE